MSTTHSTGTNVSFFFLFLHHSVGPVLASLFPSGNKLSLPIRDATHKLNSKTLHVPGKIEKGIFWHLLGILSHIFSTRLVFMIKKMHYEHELPLKSGVLRLFLLSHEHRDSESWVTMRLESESSSSTILTLCTRAHLHTPFLPFLLLG